MLRPRLGDAPQATAHLGSAPVSWESGPLSVGNKALVEALLSRLRHQCHTVKIDGPSLRDPQG